MTSPRLAAVLVTAAALAVPASIAVANANHPEWPAINGRHWSADSTGKTFVLGTPRNDELLGGAGSDRIYGRGGNDVIWGTRLASENNAAQHDILDGGPGRDYIYASKGRNDISGGPGNDVIRAHFGTGGVIDCGPGDDVVQLSHRSARRYVIRNCEHRTFN